jgi:hypothetical protein
MSGKAARARQNADPAGYSRGAICAPSRGSVRTRPGRERHGCRGRRRRGGLGDQGAGRALRHRARAPGAVLDSGQAAVGCRGSRRPRRTSCEGAPRRPLPGSARSGALLATATRRQAARPAHPCDRQGGPVDHRHRPCGADQPAASDRTRLINYRGEAPRSHYGARAARVEVRPRGGEALTTCRSRSLQRGRGGVGCGCGMAAASPDASEAEVLPARLREAGWVEQLTSHRGWL